MIEYPNTDDQWLQQAYRILKKDQGSGLTSERPTNGLEIGSYYFDTTLGHIIHYDGSGWVDATGASV